ncbi:MAG: hypothetical protein WBA93_15595 [Microcoleaceae cyanobacterium]
MQKLYCGHSRRHNIAPKAELWSWSVLRAIKSDYSNWPFGSGQKMSANNGQRKKYRKYAHN